MDLPFQNRSQNTPVLLSISNNDCECSCCNGNKYFENITWVLRKFMMEAQLITKWEWRSCSKIRNRWQFTQDENPQNSQAITARLMSPLGLCSKHEPNWAEERELDAGFSVAIMEHRGVYSRFLCHFMPSGPQVKKIILQLLYIPPSAFSFSYCLYGPSCLRPRGDSSGAPLNK